jgi:rhodanese-related sulfurtransferase
MKKRLICVLLAALALAGCAAKTTETGPAETGPSEAASYRQIDQETAKEMMARDDGHVVVDVRRQDEYDAGHIPGAILVPNESIGCDSPEALPDYDQVILVYCRSGNRSKQAAKKLAAMGYANVFEFGGINDWKGEVTPPEALQPVPVLLIEAGEKRFYASLEKNPAADAFIKLLTSAPLTLEMEDAGGFEKTAALSLPAEAGDLLLKGGALVLNYGGKPEGKTGQKAARLARIDGAQAKELAEALGTGSVAVRFSLEWSE